jgi:Interferon gamma receptor (IFNGR1).
MLLFRLVFGFLTVGFTFCDPRTANSPSKSSKLQILTYMSITQKVCITATEQHSHQDVSRDQSKLVCISLFVKQRQEGKG